VFPHHRQNVPLHAGIGIGIAGPPHLDGIVVQMCEVLVVTVTVTVITDKDVIENELDRLLCLLLHHQGIEAAGDLGQGVGPRPRDIGMMIMSMTEDVRTTIGVDNAPANA